MGKARESMSRDQMIDAGVFIALSSNPSKGFALVSRWKNEAMMHRTTRGAVARVWRDPPDPTIAKLLAAMQRVEPISDDAEAKQVGVLLGQTGHRDVVDASLVVAAKRTGRDILTTDPDDIGELAEAVDVEFQTFAM